jgi:hypothetical protein
VLEPSRSTQHLNRDTNERAAMSEQTGGAGGGSGGSTTNAPSLMTNRSLG